MNCESVSMEISASVCQGGIHFYIKTRHKVTIHSLTACNIRLDAILQQSPTSFSFSLGMRCLFFFVPAVACCGKGGEELAWPFGLESSAPGRHSNVAPTSSYESQQQPTFSLTLAN